MKEFINNHLLENTVKVESKHNITVEHIPPSSKVPVAAIQALLTFSPLFHFVRVRGGMYVGVLYEMKNLKCV